jgi:hypothetical protein
MALQTADGGGDGLLHTAAVQHASLLNASYALLSQKFAKQYSFSIRQVSLEEATVIRLQGDAIRKLHGIISWPPTCARTPNEPGIFCRPSIHNMFDWPLGIHVFRAHAPKAPNKPPFSLLISPEFSLPRYHS